MNSLNISSEYIKNTQFDEIITRLINTYNPATIYLFGSYAWGTPQKHSDIDLFIVVDKSNLNQADRIRLGLKALTDINQSVDLLVFTKEETESKKDHPSTLTHKVFTKGIKLYEAA